MPPPNCIMKKRREERREGERKRGEEKEKRERKGERGRNVDEELLLHVVMDDAQTESVQAPMNLLLSSHSQ